MKRHSMRWSGRVVCLHWALAVLLLNVPALATVLSNWPDWGNTKRTLKVHIRNGNDAFKNDVRTAMSNWNAANMGNNNWKFEEVATAAEANVSVGEEDPGAGNTGLASPTTKATGLFGWGAGKLNSVNVKIKPGMSGNSRINTIMHELGHCMRMDHTNGAADIMGPTQTTTTQPSANDKSEALASDKDPPCPFAANTNLLRGIPGQFLTLTPKIGAGINLATVVNVNITSETGPDFNATVLNWNVNGIQTQFNVFPTADHNEVFRVTLHHSDSTLEHYTGVLTITDDPAPSGLPRAVAGSDVTVAAGTPVMLDGSGSFHEAPNVFFSGTWLVNLHNANTDGLGIFAEVGELLLPPGTHTATLEVMDYYGRTSYDSITVTVLPEGAIPTVSEWGLVVLSLLVLTAGTILLRWQRRTRPAAA